MVKIILWVEIKLAYGSVTQAVFNMWGCRRQLCFHRDSNFSYYQQSNSLPQPHESSVAHVNDPLPSYK